MMGIASHLAKATPSGYARGGSPCFSHPARNEIEMEGKKIIGSAQKRTGSKFIQHGSIPLEKEDVLLKSVSPLDHKEKIIKMTSLSDSLGRAVQYDWAVEHFIAGMADFFQVRLVPRSFSRPEQNAIREIQQERYENPGWTYAY
jgi:lipoate-protein ligase A